MIRDCYQIITDEPALEKTALSKMPEYSVWSNIKWRCSGKCKSKNNSGYANRGIKICERWANSFQNFLDDMGPRPSPDHSIDRINNNGDYCPENCRWTTAKVQANNTRRTKFLEYRGETKPLTTWAEELGLSKDLIKNRIFRYKMSVEEAFERPIRKTVNESPKEFVVDGETLTIEQCSQKFNLTKERIRMRFAHGWDTDRIMKTPESIKKRQFPKKLEFNGEALTAKEWASKTGINESEIRSRFRKGWTIERILTQPMRKR